MIKIDGTPLLVGQTVYYPTKIGFSSGMTLDINEPMKAVKVLKGKTGFWYRAAELHRSRPKPEAVE